VTQYAFPFGFSSPDENMQTSEETTEGDQRK
jgi:hypothetical protein